MGNISKASTQLTPPLGLVVFYTDSMVQPLEYCQAFAGINTPWSMNSLALSYAFPRFFLSVRCSFLGFPVDFYSKAYENTPKT